MIQTLTANVYYAPTKRRRYFSKDAAVKAEAAAIITKRYPIEPFEPDTGNFYDIRIDKPKRYTVMHRRMCRLIRRIKA